MNSITHFSHEHPLNLQEQFPSMWNFLCDACHGGILPEENSSDVYACDICHGFLIHKFCAQLPNEIVHKSHENHSLFLRPGLSAQLPNEIVHKSHETRPLFRCANCKYERKMFFYYCYLCDFSLDIICAFMKRDKIISYNKNSTFCHPSHKHHQLMVLPRPTLVPCDACGTKDKDLSYHCLSCHFWIHKTCAMLPTKNTYSFHSHPVTLAFSLPPQYHDNFYYHCDICNYIIKDTKFWFYYCELCRYFVHIGCMTKKKLQIEVDLKGLVIKDLPRVPMLDKSVELIQRFLLVKDSLVGVQPKISMFSHMHPLIYSNDHVEDEDGEEILCDACIEPIFAPPYYHCADCRYYLHLTCAKLPQQLQHPSHPHLLTLTSKMRIYEEIMCNLCFKYSNGFYFYCTSEDCEFNLDVKCAALPNIIKHDYHNHPLFQLPGLQDKICQGCGYDTQKYGAFGCNDCGFYLHIDCIMLRKMMKHRCDGKHPLLLRFPPHAYHPKPFDCYQCEKEINPNYWLYHCEECDLSFHVRCFNPTWPCAYMKFGQKVQIGYHKHPLKYVHKASVASSRCHHCDRCDRGYASQLVGQFALGPIGRKVVIKSPYPVEEEYLRNLARRWVRLPTHILRPPDDETCFTFECETCKFRLCLECFHQLEPLS